MNGAIILAAIEAVAQLVKFIGEALSHGKREWTAEQEAEFDRRLEEAFAGAGHWRKGTERTEGTKGTP